MFEKGDRIICIKEPSGGGDPYKPILGCKYIAGEVYSDMVNIINDKGVESHGWLNNRFEIVYDKGTCGACNSKCKQDKICSLYMERE